MDATSYPTMIDSQNTMAGGCFKKSLDRLTRVLERKVDRQVMAAQIRAYENTSDLSEKPRYM
jgi:hypothetical protein